MLKRSWHVYNSSPRIATNSPLKRCDSGQWLLPNKCWQYRWIQIESLNPENKPAEMTEHRCQCDNKKEKPDFLFVCSEDEPLLAASQQQMAVRWRGLGKLTGYTFTGVISSTQRKSLSTQRNNPNLQPRDSGEAGCRASVSRVVLLWGLIELAVRSWIMRLSVWPPEVYNMLLCCRWSGAQKSQRCHHKLPGLINWRVKSTLEQTRSQGEAKHIMKLVEPRAWWKQRKCDYKVKKDTHTCPWEWGNLSHTSQILTSDRQKCQLQTQVNM